MQGYRNVILQIISLFLPSVNQENMDQGKRAPAGRLNSEPSNNKAGARRRSKGSADFVRGGMMVVNLLKPSGYFTYHQV